MTIVIPNNVQGDKGSNTQKRKVHLNSKEINPIIQPESQDV